MIYNKLVRDLIPEYIISKGATPITHIATEDEYRTKLYEKLQEEAKELAEKPSIEELADLQEVILAIYALEGWTTDEVESKRVIKATERGAFEKRIILEES